MIIFWLFNVYAIDINIDIRDLNSGKSIGDITAKQSLYSVVFIPHLSAGLHGFHLHEHP